MKASEAGQRLSEMVAAEGLERQGEVTIDRVLDAFGRFASLDVDDVEARDDGDLLLFETAVPTPGVLEISLSRQLFVQTTDEDQEMVDVSLVAHVPMPTELSEAPEAQIWGCGGPPWEDSEFRATEEFVTEVRATNALRTAASRTATRVFVERR
jgi:hypothetical protein